MRTYYNNFKVIIGSTSSCWSQIYAYANVCVSVDVCVATFQSADEICIYGRRTPPFEVHSIDM